MKLWPSAPSSQYFILFFFFLCLPQLVASPIWKTGWTASPFGQLIKYVIGYLWICDKFESWQSHGNTAVLLAIESRKTGVNSRSELVHLNSATNTSKLITSIKHHFRFYRTTTNILKYSSNKCTPISNHRIRTLITACPTIPNHHPNNTAHLNWSFKSGYCRSRAL